MVVHFNFHAHFLQYLAYAGAQIVQTIHRWNREITTFHTRAVTVIAFLVLCPGIPRTFFRINIVESRVHISAKTDAVEHKKLRFRAEESLVGNTTGL